MLRDECERRARIEEAKMNDPELSDLDQRAAMDAAKVYWQMSRNWADTVGHAADVYPANFRNQNNGPQKRTLARKAFLGSIATGEQGETFESIASLAVTDRISEAQCYWPGIKSSDHLRIVNFLKKHGLD